MQIRTQQYLAGFLTLLVILLVLFGAIRSSQEMQAALTQSDLAARLNVKGISGLRQVTVEHLLFQTERTRQQWLAQHASLAAMLAEVHPSSSEEQLLLLELGRLHAELGRLFDHLLQLHGDGPLGRVTSELSPAVQETRSRLTAQIMITTQEMVELVTELILFNAARQNSAHRQLYVLILLLAAVAVLGVVGQHILLQQRILRPVLVLRDNAQRIEKGQPGIRNNFRSGDEIGALAQAVDHMVAELEAAQDKLAKQAASRLVQVRQLAEEKSLLAETVFNASREGLFITDPDERIITVNPAFTRITGYTLDEVAGKTPRVLSSGLQPPSFYADLWQAINTDGFWHGELCNRHKSGRIYVEALTIARVSDAHGVIKNYVGSITDISDRKEFEARLQLAAQVFSHAREAIMITDAGGNIIDVNDAFLLTTGYARSEVIGAQPSILKSSRHDRGFFANLWQQVLARGYWSGEIWNQRKTGSEYVSLLTLSAVSDPQGQVQHIVALFSDITELKKHQEQLEYTAHYDALTGLPNRLLLADRLRSAKSQADRRKHFLAVLFLDLDGFKPINDQHGHAVGDQVLVVVAQRMQQALRTGDTIARVGGDEFVAVLIDLETSAGYLPIVQRLLQTVAEPILIDSLRLQISTSIGLALYPEDGQDPDQLLRNADQAMYQAKQAGRNRFQRFVLATHSVPEKIASERAAPEIAVPETTVTKEAAPEKTAPGKKVP